MRVRVRVRVRVGVWGRAGVRAGVRGRVKVRVREDELAVDDLRLAGDGRAAVAVERREEGALAGDRRECLVVVERADIPRHLLVLVADLDADRAL